MAIWKFRLEISHQISSEISRENSLEISLEISHPKVAPGQRAGSLGQFVRKCCLNHMRLNVGMRYEQTESLKDACNSGM